MRQPFLNIRPAVWVILIVLGLLTLSVWADVFSHRPAVDPELPAGTERSPMWPASW